MKSVNFNILFVNNTRGDFQDMNKLRILLINNLVAYFDKEYKDKEYKDISISIESSYVELNYVDDIIKKYKEGNHNYIFGMFSMEDLIQFKNSGLLGHIIVPTKDEYYNSLLYFRIIIDLLKTTNNPIPIHGLLTISKDIPIKEYY